MSSGGVASGGGIMDGDKKDRKRELAMGKAREGVRRKIIGMDDQK